MEQRDLNRGGMADPSFGRDQDTSAAGAANTPPFETGTSGLSSSGGGQSADRLGGTGARDAGGTGGDRMGAIAPAGTSQGGASTGEGNQSQSGGSGGLKERAGEIRNQAENRVNQTMDRAADTLENAAHRLDQVADRGGAGGTGPKAKAGQVAHSTADTMESIARYLRDNDMQGLQRDLERQVRTNPVQTLLIGVAAGWVVGKILR
jgi:ElaB/YqjD/DUF883 family membrane-anchored ribosome-binding protein